MFLNDANPIFEDILDDIDEIRPDILTGLDDDGSVIGSREPGPNVIYFHGKRYMSAVGFRVDMSDADRFVLNVLVAKAKTIGNISFFACPKQTSSPLNVTDADTISDVLGLSLDKIFYALEICMSFDYDETRKGDVAYMFSVLEESCRIFYAFITEICKVRLRLFHFSYVEEFDSDGDDPDISNGCMRRMFRTRIVDRNNLEDFYQILTALKSLGAEVTEDSLEKCMEMRAGINGNGDYYLKFISLGARPSIARRLEGRMSLDEKIFEFRIPEGVETSLGEMTIGRVAKERERILYVIGTLDVNSIAEFVNLKFIDRNRENGCVRFRTTVPKGLLRKFLKTFFFNEIDLSRASVIEDGSSPISLAQTRNPDIEVTGAPDGLFLR